MNVTGANGQEINSNDQVAAGATVNSSVVPVPGKTPTAKINGSTAIALTAASGTTTYTGSFQMPDKGTVLEINSDPSDLDQN